MTADPLLDILIERQRIAIELNLALERFRQVRRELEPILFSKHDVGAEIARRMAKQSKTQTNP